MADDSKTDARFARCCAWCGKHLCDGIRGSNGEYLSHGICEDCAEKLKQKYRDGKRGKQSKKER